MQLFALPALPIPSEQPIALHANTAVIGLILTSLTNPNDLSTLGADKCSQLISCIVCTGVQTL